MLAYVGGTAGAVDVGLDAPPHAASNDTSAGTAAVAAVARLRIIRRVIGWPFRGILSSAENWSMWRPPHFL
ncbi:MAG: hypothetical protein ACR2PL_00355 [Dehalococcoidia bacterium]